MISLSDLKAGEDAVVASIKGGRGMIRKLESLGIRPGGRLKKISSQLMGGPVVVQVGNTQVAIGFGMARRILVKKI
ncbi:MAG TPA: ferrous iron transport protein A [bacterium (Candidatus Stahlbacteria)]|nr:ferrous iron transport protein A [Candidatus Stahlbacteria bacterium]